MKSVLFFIALVFQVGFLVIAPVSAQSEATDNQQQEQEVETPIIDDYTEVPSQGFFSQLAERFKNLFSFFKDEGEKAEAKADMYDEKAERYSADAEAEPEESLLGKILRRIANMYNRAASLWRKKSDSDNMRADLYQKKADQYETLSENAYESKEHEMANCFSNVKKTYDEKKKIDLIAKGVSQSQVECNNMGFPVSSGIWWASLPDDLSSSCFEVSGGTASEASVITYPMHSSGTPSLSEEEKQTKLDACKNHLNELLDEGMQSCWQKSQNVLLDLKKQKLLEDGADYNLISCSSDAAPSDDPNYIWHASIESSVTCENTANDIVESENLLDLSTPFPDVSAFNKQSKMKNCVGILSENSQFLKSKRIAAVSEDIGQCLKNKAEEMDNRLKKNLQAQGVLGPYECNPPESYFIIRKDSHLLAHGVGGCHSSKFQVDDALTFAVECPLSATVVSLPNEDENWDACIKRNMQEAKRDLLQGKAAGTYSCSGRYGGNRGWSITCNSRDKFGSYSYTTGYQPYPSTCGALPENIALQRGNAGASTGTE